MRLVLLIAAILFSFSLCAQNHLLGIKGGLNYMFVETDHILEPDEYKPGAVCGISYEYQFKKPFQVGIDLLYSQRGAKMDLRLSDQTGAIIGETSLSYNFDYLAMPVKGGMHFGDRLKGLVNIGVIPAFILKAERVLPEIDSDGDEFNSRSEFTDEVNQFDLAGLFELGANYGLTDRLYLSANLSYQYSFTSLSNDEFFPNSESYHNGMRLLLGVTYSL
ncbi:outer membrane beta-barrel protein [Halocola ammonii]